MINNNMVISKSAFLRFKRCPKAFWMYLNKPELAIQDPTMQNHVKDGILVGSYAKKYFKNFDDVTTYDEHGNLDLNEMEEKTNQLLLKGNDTVIAEATFSVNGLFCSVDLLKPNGKSYDVYEVKATTSVEKDHYLDAAFQANVLTKRGLIIDKVYILHLNKGYVRHGDIDVHSLFVKEDVSSYPEFLSASSNFAQDIEDIRKITSLEKEPSKLLFQGCKECPFKAYCHKDVPSPSILDINGLKGAYEYFNNGVVSYRDVLVNNVKLNNRQKVQVEAYLGNKDTIINKKSVEAFLKTIKYPLYHLDFESIRLPIPPADGCSPYTQIPTQYSLHIEQDDGSLKHKSFLGDSIDPRREIAESLCKNIPLDSCVLAYSKNFECSRLQELADLYPDLRKHLLNIKDNVIDLIVPFKSGAYYHRNMGGSNSIKYVLPALYPNEKELDYHALPVVHNGAEAMDFYPVMIDADQEEKERIRDGLLKYCCLDTLAMVKVLNVLKKSVK